MQLRFFVVNAYGFHCNGCPFHSIMDKIRYYCRKREEERYGIHCDPHNE